MLSVTWYISFFVYPRVHFDQWWSTRMYWNCESIRVDDIWMLPAVDAFSQCSTAHLKIEFYFCLTTTTGHMTRYLLMFATTCCIMLLCNTNKCIEDDTKAAARQNPNCILKKIWRKRFSIWRIELLHPATWHDHDTDFARWLHSAMWQVALG